MTTRIMISRRSRMSRVEERRVVRSGLQVQYSDPWVPPCVVWPSVGGWGA